jgi:hypothetical protein
LLNKTSILRPKVSVVRKNRLWTASGSVTSVGTTSAREPAEPDSAAVVSKGSLRRQARATEYPLLRKASDVCLPMPDPAPVTIATFLVELICQIS